MRKHIILFLAANPHGTDRLALDREARSIELELARSGHRDRFAFATRWAVEPLDLLRELRALRPTVVHYSGHGGPGGLFFQAPEGGVHRISAHAIAETFGAAGASVRLVVLSACYSEEHATALLAHIDCVVGFAGPALDGAARSFAIGFYGGLGDRESVAAAYKQGCAAIALEASSARSRVGTRDAVAATDDCTQDSSRPRLTVRAGVDASQVILGMDPLVPRRTGRGWRGRSTRRPSSRDPRYPRPRSGQVRDPARRPSPVWWPGCAIARTWSPSWAFARSSQPAISRRPRTAASPR